MTVRATKFTPEVLLSAPRRTNGVPNARGTLVLYVVSTYSFEKHKKTSEVRVLDVGTKESTVVTGLEGASEPTWLDDDTVLLLAPGDKGVTKVLVGPIHGFDERSAAPDRGSSYAPTILLWYPWTLRAPWDCLKSLQDAVFRPLYNMSGSNSGLVNISPARLMLPPAT